MRLIDADALIHELNNSHYPGAPYIDAGISIAIGKVCDAPTIELEPEHIHCKDCRWFEPDRHQCGRQVCAVFYEDDYCSFAERCTDETD